MTQPPRPATKCRRCQQRYDAHVRALWCPDSTGRTFTRQADRRSVMRFERGELTTLEAVLRNALHAGGNARELLELLGKVRYALSQREKRTGATGERAEAKAS